MIDSDIVPPPNYLNLVNFQKDIISGLCFAFTKGNIYPLILKKDKVKVAESKYYPYKSIHPDKWTGLIECDAVGTGAVILSRRVLEAVPYPFRNEYHPKTGEKMLGLDLNFCRRAKMLGYKVFCHTDYQCSHHTRMDLKTIYYTMTKTFEGIETLDKEKTILIKENAILKGKLANKKNSKKNKKKGKRQESGLPTVGNEENKVSRTEGENVQGGGDNIPVVAAKENNPLESFGNEDTGGI